MNALDILRVFVRHKMLAGILLIATVAVVFTIYGTTAVSYEQGATVVVLGPNVTVGAGGKASAFNPLQAAGSQAAQITAATLVLLAQTNAFRDQLTSAGVKSSVTVTSGSIGGGIVINIATGNAKANVASRDARTVAGLLATTLRNQQVKLGAPADQMYVVRKLYLGGSPSRVTTSKVKTSGVAAVVGLLVTLMVILTYDYTQRRPDRVPDATADDGSENAGNGRAPRWGTSDGEARDTARDRHRPRPATPAVEQPRPHDDATSSADEVETRDGLGAEDVQRVAKHGTDESAKIESPDGPRNVNDDVKVPSRRLWSRPAT